MTELKACPFCGGEPTINKSGYHYINCPNCFAMTGCTGDREKLINNWNTRQPQGIPQGINWQPIENVPFNKKVLLAGLHEDAEFYTTGKIKEGRNTFETYPFVGDRNSYYSDNVRIPKTVFTHFAELTSPKQ